jgi:hypothetical protein
MFTRNFQFRQRLKLRRKPSSMAATVALNGGLEAAKPP